MPRTLLLILLSGVLWVSCESESEKDRVTFALYVYKNGDTTFQYIETDKDIPSLNKRNIASKSVQFSSPVYVNTGFTSETGDASTVFTFLHSKDGDFFSYQLPVGQSASTSEISFNGTMNAFFVAGFGQTPSQTVEVDYNNGITSFGTMTLSADENTMYLEPILTIPVSDHGIPDESQFRLKLYNQFQNSSQGSQEYGLLLGINSDPSRYQWEMFQNNYSSFGQFFIQPTDTIKVFAYRF